MSLALRSILQSILDGETRGIGCSTVCALRRDALAMGLLPRDSDGSPKGGDAEGGSVRSATARAEGIAQNKAGQSHAD